MTDTRRRQVAFVGYQRPPNSAGVSIFCCPGPPEYDFDFGCEAIGEPAARPISRSDSKTYQFAFAELAMDARQSADGNSKPTIAALTPTSAPMIAIFS